MSRVPKYASLNVMSKTILANLDDSRNFSVKTFSTVCDHRDASLLTDVHLMGNANTVALFALLNSKQIK